MSVELRGRGRSRKRRRSSRGSEPAVQANTGHRLPATERQDHHTVLQEQSRADQLFPLSSDDEDSISSKRFRPIHESPQTDDQPGISGDTSELQNRSSSPSLPRVESPTSPISDDDDYWFQFMTRTDTPVIFSDDEDDEEDVVFVRRLPLPQVDIGLLEQQELLFILSTYNHHPTMLFDPKSVSEQTKCAICLGDYVEGEELMTLPCTHNFHCTCVQHWLQESNTCPVCRREVD